MNPARDRYDDRHVREDSSLADVAEDYVQRYEGDFLFLRDCRERLAVGTRLSVAQVRGVLNCMRGDPRVGNLPVPARMVDVVGEVVDIRTRRRKTVVPVRPSRIDLPTNWKLVYGVSSHKLARTVHRVDTRWSGVRYFPQSDSPFADRFSVQLRWVCPANVPYRYPSGWLAPREYAVELLSRTDAVMLVREHVDAGWRLCPRCERDAAPYGGDVG